MASAREVDVAPGWRLWAEEHGDPAAPALLLVMGANAPGVAWPDALVARLAAHHRVVRYDHRDTGRSTRAFAERPYPIRTLAADALAVLDAFGVDRAHVVGMSLGGYLTQLLMVDAPERLRTATVLGAGPLDGAATDDLPGPRPEVLAIWRHLLEPRDPDAHAIFELEHWRVLSAADAGGAFDEAEVRGWIERAREHAGHHAPSTAHALADQSGLDRGADLAGASTPLLVLDSPLDPVAPPPSAARLAELVPGARLVTVPRLAHALPAALVPAVADAILRHTAQA